MAPGATIDEAVSGGEDYELLMTTSDSARLRMIFQDRHLREPITIGRVVADPLTRTHQGAAFTKSGWQHRF